MRHELNYNEENGIENIRIGPIQYGTDVDINDK